MQRARGWVRTNVKVVLALVGTPVLLVLVAFWVVAPLTLKGCAVEINLSSRPVGIQAAAGGDIVVKTGLCDETFDYSAVALRAGDGNAVWRVDTDPGPHPDPGLDHDLTIGTTPQGFHEVVPLAAPLDRNAIYHVELYLLAQPPEPTATTSIGLGSTSTTFDRAFYLACGGTASFRPADLRPGRVWFDGALVTPDGFADRTCDPRTTEA